MYHAFPRELAEASTRLRCDASVERGDVGRRGLVRDPPGSGGPEGSAGVQKRRMSFREQLNRFRRKPKKSDKKVMVETPASEPAVSRECDQVPLRPLKPIDSPPVVPKFFGYYLLLKPDGRVFFELSEGHGECGEDGTCGVAWPPAILLIEDCGDPIQPSLFRDAHRYVIILELLSSILVIANLRCVRRWKCYRLLDGLHDAGFVAGQLPLTAWTEKMLVQPGPLDVPREARSYATPSFRLVDFGRAQCRQVGLEEHWQEWCDHDLDGAFDALQLDLRAS